MKIRTRRTALLAWLPVLCLVALSFSTAPVSSKPRQAGTLTVTPKKFYGGQGVTFKGKLGRSGKRTIWLEFHMGRPGDAWTKVEGSNQRTAADGSFKFVFPARGMNNIKLRVAAKGTSTPPVNFTATDQAVTVAVRPANLSYGGTCGGSHLEYLRYDAVASEGMQVVVDASPAGEPVLKGRQVFLEERGAGNKWSRVDTAALDGTGRATFDLTATGSSPVAYRARLGEWRKNGSRIGWFPSFPTYVEPQQRPAPVSGLAKADPDPSDPPSYVYPEDVAISWAPITGAKDVVVAWNRGGSAPTDPDDADRSVVRPAGTTRHVVANLDPSTSYSFAVFARSDRGICSTRQARTVQTDAEPTPPAVTGFNATAVSSSRVDLTWSTPTGQALERIYIERNDGWVWDLAPSATSFTDSFASPGPTYTYTIYTENRWERRSPVATDSVTTPVEAP